MGKKKLDLMGDVHPGKLLRACLDDLGVTQSELARRIDVPKARISEIIRGRRRITPETGLLLDKVFENFEGSAGYFSIAQLKYDIKIAKPKIKKKLSKIVTCKELIRTGVLKPVNK